MGQEAQGEVVKLSKSHSKEQWSQDSNLGQPDHKIYTPSGTPSHPRASPTRWGSCAAWRAWRDGREEGLRQRGAERRRGQGGGHAGLDPQHLRHSGCRDSVAGPPGSISGAPDSWAASEPPAQRRHWVITHKCWLLTLLGTLPPSTSLTPTLPPESDQEEPADRANSHPRSASLDPASTTPPESLGRSPTDSGPLTPDSCYPPLCSRKRSCPEDWSLGKEPSNPRVGRDLPSISAGFPADA